MIMGGRRRHFLAKSMGTTVLLILLLCDTASPAASEIPPSTGSENKLQVSLPVGFVGWRKMNTRKEGIFTKSDSMKNWEAGKFEFPVVAGFNIRRLRLRSTTLQPPPAPLRNYPRGYVIGAPPPLI